MSAKQKFVFLLLPLLLAALFMLLDGSGLLARPNGALYDLLLRIRSTPQPDARIVLLDVDDESARLVGAWPWTRDYLADGLVLLKEMNVRSVVVDVPLAQRSAPALDAAALRKELPAALDKEFIQIQSNIQSLYDAIRRGSIRPQDSPRYVSDLVGLVAMAKVRLFNAATGIERDDDALLGQALGFFGNAYASFDLLASPDMRADADLLDLTRQRQSVNATILGGDPFPIATGIRPAVQPVVRGARGGGYSGITKDSDGVFRTALFAVRWQGMHFVPVAAAAALEMLGNPVLKVSAGRVLLENATMKPNADRVTFPLVIDDGAKLPLAWPRAASGDGFRHLSWARLIQYGRAESALAAALATMDTRGYLTYLRSDTSLLDVYGESERLRRDMLAAGSDAHGEEWAALRSQFFTLGSLFLHGDAEGRIVADTDRALAAADSADPDAQRLRAERGTISALFTSARDSFDTLVGIRSSLQEMLPGSLCIISLAGEEALQADGRTPFGTPATEAQAQAALVNSILTGSRLHFAPGWIGYIIAALLVLLIASVTIRLRPAIVLLIGVGCTVLCTAGIGGVFLVWGDFLIPAVPLISGLAGSVAAALFVLGIRRRATRAVRAAFGGRLSKEGVRTLLSQPQVLAPQGARRTMTIIALAEKGLSFGSAIHDPSDVMRQIAAYHGAVGEVVRGLDGMMGGAGVDRLTAYFGAPLALRDHAIRACRAACRIRAVEAELNVVASPPLATRMGIDTGECVVGNLGSHGMPGFSVVGAPADLAARLEALNGTFGTSLLITERVRAEIGEAFLARRVGIARGAAPETAVRVYELVAEAGTSAPGIAEAMETFEAALHRFEEREFSSALMLFARVLAALPHDGPASAYGERCRQLMAAAGESSTSFPT